MILASLFTVTTLSGATLLPAYAHNDYQNPRPLHDALAAGFRGAEADYFLVDGELLVAHDRGDVRPGRTLASLYLDPLRTLVTETGSVLSDGTPFTLNIESKQGTRAAYDALRETLASYADILTVVRDGVEVVGAVQVVLVGDHPPLAALAAENPRYVSVHRHLDELPADHAELPSHLLRMVSINYRRAFAWSGFGPRPGRFPRVLAPAVAARDAVPGRILRVFAVPRSSRVYAALLAGGVDLIGTKHLARSRDMLREILELEEAWR